MDLVKVIKELKQDKTKPYDTTATVTRIEGNTVWVHIPGGVTETPIAQTIDCQAGDRVQVRISGGKAWITGNHSKPPTDDTAANRARTVADKAMTAAKKALHTLSYFWADTEGAHVTRTPEDEFKQRPDGGNVLINADGVYLRDGTTDVAHFEQSNITMNDEAGTPVFSIGMQGNGRTITQYGLGRIVFMAMPAGTFTVTATANDVTETLTFDMSDGTLQTKQGTEITVTYSYYDYLTSGRIVRPYVTPETGTELVKVEYTTTMPLPYFVLGTRDGNCGPYSATIGEHLIAHKGLAVGKYNESNVNALFAVGSGADAENRHNAMTVTDSEVTVDKLVADQIVAPELPQIYTVTASGITWTVKQYGTRTEAYGVMSGPAEAGTALGSLWYKDWDIDWSTIFGAEPDYIQVTGNWITTVYNQSATGCKLRGYKPEAAAKAYKFYIYGGTQ